MVVDEAGATEYLNQLLQDKTTVAKMPKIFLHCERLLDEEITKVRNDLFNPSSFLQCLPQQKGSIVKLQERVFAPVKDHPKFNFVGRIIGPRGLTLRQVEQDTGCKLLVRGRGSMKDKKMEEERIGQPSYEHLQDDLHVLIMVEDCEERAKVKMEKAKQEVNFLMTPPKDGEDEIKKKQLQDLAILNGTYRHPNHQQPNQPSPHQNCNPQMGIQNGLINFPSQAPSMQLAPVSVATTSAGYPPAGMRPATNGSAVSPHLPNMYPIEAYPSEQRGPPTPVIDFTNFDPFMTAKR